MTFASDTDAELDRAVLVETQAKLLGALGQLGHAHEVIRELVGELKLLRWENSYHFDSNIVCHACRRCGAPEPEGCLNGCALAEAIVRGEMVR